MSDGRRRANVRAEPPPAGGTRLPPRPSPTHRRSSRGAAPSRPRQRVLEAVLDREDPERQRLRVLPPPLVHQQRHQDSAEARRIHGGWRAGGIRHRQRPPEVPLRLGGASEVELVLPQRPGRVHHIGVFRPVGAPHPEQRLLVQRSSAARYDRALYSSDARLNRGRGLIAGFVVLRGRRIARTCFTMIFALPISRTSATSTTGPGSGTARRSW